MTPAALTPFASAQPDLSALGYTVIPLISPHWTQHQGRGKCPGEYRSGWSGMPKWQRFRDETPSSFQLNVWSKAPDANAGLILGTSVGRDLHVIALDFDAEDPDALDTLLRAAPASPMVKRGRKGETRFYAAAKTVKSKPYDGPGGRLLDLLTGFDARQTVVPPSIHPDTLQPYVWTAGPVPAVDLPVLTDEDIEALEEALETCGWERNGRASAAVARIGRNSPNSEIDPDDIWSETKAAALANLSSWIPALPLYGLRPARGGYEAVADWRASSTGRPVSERKRNLSIQTTGIKDFGTNDTYSAIDLVMASMEVDQAAATAWLRDRLGLGEDGGVVIALGKGVISNDTLTDDDLPEPLRPRDKIIEGGVAKVERVAFEALAPKPAVSEPFSAKTPDMPAFEGGAELPFSLSCPGLVGEITDWICDTALQPQRLAALLAALQVVGVAAGRTFSGPTKTGTHLYGLFLAPSGASKDHPLKCIGRILGEAGLQAHVGPGEFMSMSALIGRLNRQPLTISAIDEFGDYLARINGRKSSPHEKAITRTLRTAWGSSFDRMDTPEWAGRVGEPIFSPALSLFGVSTHEAFFKGLDGDDVFNGFLNRFIVFSTMDRVEEVEPAKDKFEVPAEMAEAVKAIYTAAPPLTRATSHNSRSDGPLVVVPWADEWAHKAYRAYKQTCMRREDDAVFYTRSAEMAQRLAVIRAIGRDVEKAAITLEDMDWGIAIADWSASQTVAMARDYMSENQHQADVQRVLRLIRNHRSGMRHSELVRAMQHRLKSRELADVLNSLEDAGDIHVRAGERPASGGKAAKIYVPR